MTENDSEASAGLKMFWESHPSYPFINGNFKAIHQSAAAIIFASPEQQAIAKIAKQVGQPTDYATDTFVSNMADVLRAKTKEAKPCPSTVQAWAEAVASEYCENVKSFMFNSPTPTPPDGKRVEQLLNAITARMGTAMLDKLRNSMASQLTHGREYRLAFPVVVDAGRVILLVCLFASATDPKLKYILQRNGITLKANPHPSHVFLCEGYLKQAEWLKQAKQIARLFPEQPDAPEELLTSD